MENSFKRHSEDYNVVIILLSPYVLITKFSKCKEKVKIAFHLHKNAHRGAKLFFQRIQQSPDSSTSKQMPAFNCYADS